MKKMSICIFSLLFTFALIGCNQQSSMTFSGKYGFDENNLTGQLKAEVKNVEDGYIFAIATLDEPFQLFAHVEVTKFSPQGSSNFQFVVSPEDGDDIVLYDYERDGASYNDDQSIEIPAERVEVKLVGSCKSITADISLS